MTKLIAIICGIIGVIIACLSGKAKKLEKQNEALEKEITEAEAKVEVNQVATERVIDFVQEEQTIVADTKEVITDIARSETEEEMDQLVLNKIREWNNEEN